VDHEITKSLYFDDPDGTTIAACVDACDARREDLHRIAPLRPLKLWYEKRESAAARSTANKNFTIPAA
jgi:catechol-2,3-dioxygenase